MKKIMMFLIIILLNIPAPLTAVYDEERGEEIPTLSCSQKLLRLLSNLGKETARWAGNHKKSVAFSTFILTALLTTYYTLGLGDESILSSSPLGPCSFNSDGIFDLHACMHHLESSVDTSSLDLFLASAQEKLADAWKNVPDTETLKNSLTQVWEALQSHHCHIHDEL